MGSDNSGMTGGTEPWRDSLPQANAVPLRLRAGCWLRLGHDWEWERRLSVIAVLVRCARCEYRMAFNYAMPAALPWNLDAREFYRSFSGTLAPSPSTPIHPQLGGS
jgi:hypothetical protein